MPNSILTGLISLPDNIDDLLSKKNLPILKKYAIRNNMIDEFKILLKMNGFLDSKNYDILTRKEIINITYKYSILFLSKLDDINSFIMFGGKK